MNDTLSGITCVIVDDEPLARARLRALVRETGWLTCVGEAANGRMALQVIEALAPDLVFLDVRLPGPSGIDVLRRLRHAPAVMFTTAYDQFAVTAFELGAVDYLLKPFGQERFARAVERARPTLERQAGTGAAERAGEVLSGGFLPRLFVRDGGRILPLPAEAIERIEACDDYVVVHARGRGHRLNVLMSALESRLDPQAFVRIHRSHIVNLNHVTSLVPYDGSRFQLTLASGARLVSSRQRSRLLRELLSP